LFVELNQIRRDRLRIGDTRMDVGHQHVAVVKRPHPPLAVYPRWVRDESLQKFSISPVSGMREVRTSTAKVTSAAAELLKCSFASPRRRVSLVNKNCGGIPAATSTKPIAFILITRQFATRY